MRRGLPAVVMMVVSALVIVACGPTPTPRAVPTVQGFILSSPAFEPGKPIPKTFTCAGEDISPPLQWVGAPAGTKSFALIMDDPDAPLGTWVHWVLYNIPAGATGLPQKVAVQEQLPDGTRQGRNSSRRNGYSGPCPPSGTHRYFFKLYALDTTLDLAAGAGKDQLVKAMEEHILAQTELMGTFGK